MTATTTTTRRRRATMATEARDAYTSRASGTMVCFFFYVLNILQIFFTDWLRTMATATTRMTPPSKFFFSCFFLFLWLIHMYLQWLPRRHHLLPSLHHRHSLKTPANHATTRKGPKRRNLGSVICAPGIFFLSFSNVFVTTNTPLGSIF